MKIGPKTAPANDFGWTLYGSWSDLYSSDPLEDQLKAANVPFDRAEIPHLVGMGGCAYLLFYDSRLNPGTPLTVLCVPLQYDIDAFAEDYYYFSGMTRDQALADESVWLERYEKCRAALH